MSRAGCSSGKFKPRKHVPIVLDLGAVGDGETHAIENREDLAADRLANGVVGARCGTSPLGRVWSQAAAGGIGSAAVRPSLWTASKCACRACLKRIERLPHLPLLSGPGTARKRSLRALSRPCRPKWAMRNSLERLIRVEDTSAALRRFEQDGHRAPPGSKFGHARGQSRISMPHGEVRQLGGSNRSTRSGTNGIQNVHALGDNAAERPCTACPKVRRPPELAVGSNLIRRVAENGWSMLPRLLCTMLLQGLRGDVAALDDVELASAAAALGIGLVPLPGGGEGTLRCGRRRGRFRTPGCSPDHRCPGGRRVRRPWTWGLHPCAMKSAEITRCHSKVRS